MKLNAEIQANDINVASTIVQDWLRLGLHNGVKVDNVSLNRRPLTRTHDYNGNKYRVFRLTFDVPDMAAESKQLHQFIADCARAKIKIVQCPALEGTGMTLAADATPVGEFQMTDARWEELMRAGGEPTHTCFEVTHGPISPHMAVRTYSR